MAAIPVGFDFESYINRYQGYTRILRALFIAEHCEPLAVEAYKFAIAEIKETTLNTTKYKTTVDALNVVLRRQGQPSIAPDQDWVTNTTKSNKTILDNLQNDLKSAKLNMVEEEIRLTHNKLDEYYYKTGDLRSAIKNYNITYEYCIQSEHIIKMYLDEGNHPLVIYPYITHARITAERLDKVNTTSNFNCCQALAILREPATIRNCGKVANILTKVAYDSNPFFSDVMSPNDVAIYGSLCGLLSYNTRKFQSDILNNPNFKRFLSLEPELYQLVEAFNGCKYGTCLELLDRYKDYMTLDIHLQPHILTLVQLVREKAFEHIIRFRFSG